MKIVSLVIISVLVFCPGLWSQTNPVPFLDRPIVPDAAVPGSEGFTLTVNGSGFVRGSVVHWNAKARSTAFVNSSQVTATILASDVALQGTARVTVVNPNPGGGSSNVANFQVTTSTTSVGFRTRHFIVSKNLGVISEVVGDFNSDGNLDLAIVLNGYNGKNAAKVSILLGDGTGSFRHTGRVPLQPMAGNMVTGDFNGDGKLDLALVTNLNQVSILLGNGDGTFQSPRSFLTGIGATSIVTADFNQDGNLDLATSNLTDNTVSVLLGKGDGTFQLPVHSPTGGVSPFGLATADFDGDGILDLAVTEQGSDELTILMGNGDGTFTYETDLTVLDNPSVVSAADLDGDGKVDLVVGNGDGYEYNSGSSETIFLGNGDGTFQPGRTVAKSTLPEQTAVVADMNADNVMDLVITQGSQNNNAGGGNVAVWLGNGLNKFKQVYNQRKFYQFFGFPVVAAVGDFNNDGNLDVVTSSDLNLGGISILLQNPTGPALNISKISPNGKK